MSDLFTETAGNEESVWSVADLTQAVKGALRDRFPRRLSVRGETTNVTVHRSGAVYFDLKDAAALLKCVMWKPAARSLAFTPTDGMEVIATGEIDIYANASRYQLRASHLEPVGVGALDARLRQLREQLRREGLFEPSRKLTVPRFPRVIVLVTSSNAAGFRDMLKVLDRHPYVRKLIYPVAVQGDQAAPQIVEALQSLSSIRGLTILLGRGGGSLEDLWAFNEESVVRAVAACGVPIVTGIGHETDVTLADLAADHHAHTPTAAAEYLVRHWAAAPSTLDYLGTRLRVNQRRVLDARRGELRLTQRHELLRRPTLLIERRQQRVDDVDARLVQAQRERLRQAERRLGTLRQRLLDAHPRTTHARQRERVALLQRRLSEAMRTRLAAEGRRFQGLTRRADRVNPALTVPLRSERLLQLRQRLKEATRRQHAASSGRLAVARAALRSVDPTAVLQRGFTLTQTAQGRLVRAATDVVVGDELITRTGDGLVRSRVLERLSEQGPREEKDAPTPPVGD